MRKVGENAGGVGELDSAKCGDIMEICLKIKDGVILGEEHPAAVRGTAAAVLDL